jgi:hypothetical protein
MLGIFFVPALKILFAPNPPAQLLDKIPAAPASSSVFIMFHLLTPIFLKLAFHFLEISLLSFFIFS